MPRASPNTASNTQNGGWREDLANFCQDAGHDQQRKRKSLKFSHLLRYTRAREKEFDL